MATEFEFSDSENDNVLWIYGGPPGSPEVAPGVARDVAPDLAPSRRKRLERHQNNPSVGPVAELLHQRIIGQEAALERLVGSLSRISAGLNDPGRPLLTALLMGPTGVGKTETAKALSGALFGWDGAFVRIDCEEYAQGHEIAKLLGSPPGYVGHNVEPLLTQRRLDAAHRRYLEGKASSADTGGGAVDSLLPKRTKSVIAAEPKESRMPVTLAERQGNAAAGLARLDPEKAEAEYLSIVLFDEVEKAHPKLWDALLGVLEDGVLTLGDNSETCFRNSIILMTSNVGSRSMGELLQPVSLGFARASEAERPAPERMERLALESARRSFPAEFLNRLDLQLVYSPLEQSDLSRIFDRLLVDLQKRILERSGVPLLLKVSEPAKARLVNLGTDARYGARPLRRVIESELVEPLSTFISAGRVVNGDVLEIELVGDDLEFFRASRNSDRIVA